MKGSFDFPLYLGAQKNMWFFQDDATFVEGRWILFLFFGYLYTVVTM